MYFFSLAIAKVRELTIRTLHPYTLIGAAYFSRLTSHCYNRREEGGFMPTDSDFIAYNFNQKRNTMYLHHEEAVFAAVTS